MSVKTSCQACGRGLEVPFLFIVEVVQFESDPFTCGESVGNESTLCVGVPYIVRAE